MSEGIAKEREHLAEELHALRAKNTALKDMRDSRDSKHQHNLNSFGERMSDIGGLLLPDGSDENSKAISIKTYIVDCKHNSPTLTLLYWTGFLDAFPAPRDPKSADFLSFHLEF